MSERVQCRCGQYYNLDVFIGVMDTRELAAAAVEAHNQRLVNELPDL